MQKCCYWKTIIAQFRAQKVHQTGVYVVKSVVPVGTCVLTWKRNFLDTDAFVSKVDELVTKLNTCIPISLQHAIRFKIQKNTILSSPIRTRDTPRWKY